MKTNSLLRSLALITLYVFSSGCTTLMPGQVNRPLIGELFQKSKEDILAWLPGELAETAVASENQITIQRTLSHSMYNMTLPFRTETVSYRFSAGHLWQIEVRTVSEQGAMDADLAELQSFYHDLEAEYTKNLGQPSNSEREESSLEKNQGPMNVSFSRYSWNEDASRIFLPALSIEIEYRERAIQGVTSIRIRETYTVKKAPV